MNATILHNVLRRIVGQAKLVCVGFDPTQSDFNAFLEHVAQFAGELHATAARHIGNFDEKYAPVSARTVGHETGYDTWTAGHIVSKFSPQ